MSEEMKQSFPNPSQDEGMMPTPEQIIERNRIENYISQKLGWGINRKGLREWHEMGDPCEEKATAAEVRAFEMLIAMQRQINALEKFRAFAVSTIKSGEPWTNTCEQMFKETLGE